MNEISIFESAPTLIGWLEQWGPWAIAISLLLSIVISVIGVIPSIVLTGANIALFGWLPGFLISWIGEIIGAAVTFWLYRQGITIFTRNKEADWRWTIRLRELSKRKQFVALLLARITPVVPSGLVTFVAAASTVPFSIYFMASIIGKMPSVAVETLVVHDLLLWEDNKLCVVLSVLLITILYFFLRKPKNRTW